MSQAALAAQNAWNQLVNTPQEDETRINWLMLTEKDSVVQVLGTGQGGLAALLDEMADPHVIYWAALQVVAVTTIGTGSKKVYGKTPMYVRFTQVGLNVDSARRAQVMNSDVPQLVNELMKNAAVHLQIQGDDKIDLNQLALSLLASLPSTAPRPIRFDSAPGEILVSL